MPEPRHLYSPKLRVKAAFKQLVGELFDGETTDDFGYTHDPKTTALHVIGRYPREVKETPSITVKVGSIRYATLTVNRGLPSSEVLGINQAFEEVGDQVGRREGYGFVTTVSFDVTSNSDDQRDELIDQLAGYFLFKDNDAGIDIVDWLETWGLAYKVDDVATDGDAETVLGTDDLVYADGFVLQVMGNAYSKKHLAQVLGGVDFVPTIVD